MLAGQRHRKADLGLLHRTLQTLREQMRRMDQVKEKLKSEPDGQLSLTEPDARSMMSQAKATGLAASHASLLLRGSRQHFAVAQRTRAACGPGPQRLEHHQGRQHAPVAHAGAPAPTVDVHRSASRTRLRGTGAKGAGWDRSRRAGSTHRTACVRHRALQP
jgi:hypothetical protein